MAESSKRVEVGFDGGQVIALRLPAGELDKLRSALSAGGWQRVAAEDAEIDLALEKVVFLRTAGDDQKVGF